MGYEYRMFVDEVGTPTLRNLSDRYFSLTGLMLRREYLPKLEARLNEYKRDHFPKHGTALVLHRKEMVRSQGAFRRLRSPNKRERAWSDMREILKVTPFKMVTVVIDKRSHSQRRQAMAWNSYQYCMMVLLERFVLELQERDHSTGDVVAEARGGNADLTLKRVFAGLVSNGTTQVTRPEFSAALSSSRIKIVPKSANYAGLQLVDQVAAPAHRHVLSQDGVDVRIHPVERLTLDVVEPKFRRRGARVDGYGTKLLR